LNGCCTNNTQRLRSFRHKSLFTRKILVWLTDGPSPRRQARLPRLALLNDTLAPNRAIDSCPRAQMDARRAGNPAIVCREPLYLLLNEVLAGRSCRQFQPPIGWRSRHSKHALFDGERPVRGRPLASAFTTVVSIESGQSAACGSPPCRAYRPCWRRGRVAEGGGLLNRYRVVKPYRGFESLRLRQSMFCPARAHNLGSRTYLRNG
jgi:hypothetical protein